MPQQPGERKDSMTASTATTSATTAAASSASTPDASKTYVAFFTREETKGPKVAIFKNLSEKARAPLFDGKIGGKRVSMFLRKGPNGNFLGLVGEKLTDGSNNSENMGSANVRTLGTGVPILVIDLIGSDGKKTPVFASISQKVSQEVLESIGLDAVKQAERRANPVKKVKAAAAPAEAAKA